MEFTGKTIDQAIKEGLSALGASLDEVDVKIISEGGLFKKAKVDITRSVSHDEHDTTMHDEEKGKEQEKVEEKEVEQISTPQESLDLSTTEETDTIEVEEKPKQLTEEQKQQIAKMVAQVKEYIVSFMKKMCYLFNQIGDVEIEENGRDLHVNLKSNIRQMIGYHGESLDAYQTILNNAVSNHFEHFRGRIYLDVDRYKANREQSLIHLAKRMANKVIVARKSMKLEPMRSYERKVIHNALSKMDHISTHSEGEEPKRYIVIDYIAN